MKKYLVFLLCALLLCPAALAEGAPQFTVDEYPVVDGSTATLPLSYALMQASTGCTLEDAQRHITHTRTTESFSALINGSADLLIVYEPEASAYEYAEQEGVSLLQTPIGRDAMVFLVNDSNPVRSLSHKQIQGIYTGEIANWKDVGGEDRPIIAYQRSESSGSQVMMKKQVMQGVPMADPPKELRPGGMGELIDCIASYKNEGNAIGYSVYYYVANMYMQEGVRLLDVNGVTPSNETIASGEYPYTQDFYAVIRADEPDGSPARQLYDFLLTDAGRDLIADAGYVAVNPQ
ncbi:MAG: substrate-binding domain-containing protein [Clostridia bacterium]|nr:substrate-binding domain-containing protein [Clostridia bacterium]